MHPIYQHSLSSGRCQDVYYQKTRTDLNVNLPSCCPSLFLGRNNIVIDALVPWTGGILSTKNVEKENNNTDYIKKKKKDLKFKYKPRNSHSAVVRFSHGGVNIYEMNIPWASGQVRSSVSF